jgi:hypothetical protein
VTRARAGALVAALLLATLPLIVTTPAHAGGRGLVFSETHCHELRGPKWLSKHVLGNYRKVCIKTTSRNTARGFVIARVAVSKVKGAPARWPNHAKKCRNIYAKHHAFREVYFTARGGTRHLGRRSCGSRAYWTINRAVTGHHTVVRFRLTGSRQGLDDHLRFRFNVCRSGVC